MKVLITLDSFKGSLSAEEACDIVATALHREDPQATIEQCPLTDGGEGFASILTKHAQGEIIKSTVRGPIGDSVEALWGIIETSTLTKSVQDKLNVEPGQKLAIIEMAQASGLPGLPTELRNPWKTTTYGTGELLGLAADGGVGAILIGLGGSATNDMGIGALQALGLGCNCQGIATPAKWKSQPQYKNSLRKMPPIKIASDVTNPLTGNNGATSVFGPQKGLKAEDIPILDKLVDQQAKALCELYERPVSFINEPGSGAAGGIAFGLKIALGAEILDGFGLVSQWLELEDKIREANLVITGEGKFDMTSLQGKGPGAVLKIVSNMKKPIWIMAGLVEAEAENAIYKNFNGAKIRQITPNDYTLDRGIKEAKSLLIKEISKLYNELRLEKNTK